MQTSTHHTKYIQFCDQNVVINIVIIFYYHKDILYSAFDLACNYLSLLLTSIYHEWARIFIEAWQ